MLFVARLSRSLVADRGRGRRYATPPGRPLIVRTSLPLLSSRLNPWSRRRGVQSAPTCRIQPDDFALTCAGRPEGNDGNLRSVIDKLPQLSHSRNSVVAFVANNKIYSSLLILIACKKKKKKQKQFSAYAIFLSNAFSNVICKDYFFDRDNYI